MNNFWQHFKWMFVGLVIMAAGLTLSLTVFQLPITGIVLTSAIVFTIWFIAYRQIEFYPDMFVLSFILRVAAFALLMLWLWGAYSVEYNMTLEYIGSDLGQDTFQGVLKQILVFNPWPLFYKLVVWTAVYALADGMLFHHLFLKHESAGRSSSLI